MVQPDGRIVTGGYAYNGTVNVFAVTRCNTDGTLDTSLGGSGEVTAAFPNSEEDIGSAVALQPDGKIVVAGESLQPNNFDLAVARFNPDGSLDTSFGNNGLVLTRVGNGPNGSQATGVAVQSDGRIIVTGFTDVGKNQNMDLDFLAVRYQSNGSLDPTFGRAGKTITSLGSTSDYGLAMALQPDGDVIVGGETQAASGHFEFALVRYRTNGTVDPKFGSHGVVRTPVGSFDDGLFALLIQPDGRIVAGGYSDQYDGYERAFALARYLPNGSLDTSFGTGGQVVSQVGAQGSQIFALGLDDQGRIDAGGQAIDSRDFDEFALARFTTTGALDASFGSGGSVTTAIGPRDATAEGLAIQTEGRILLAGETNIGAALARYLP